jgi:hypothetical protein
MPHKNLIGQEINVGDLIFEYYPQTPSGWVREGIVSRFSQKSVFYNFVDKHNGELILREAYCKPKYIIIVGLNEFETYINSENCNNFVKDRITNLIEYFELNEAQ